MAAADAASSSIDAAVHARAPGFRAQVVIDMRRAAGGKRFERESQRGERYLRVGGIVLQRMQAPGAQDPGWQALIAVHREVTAVLWRAYRERRGWRSP